MKKRIGTALLILLLLTQFVSCNSRRIAIEEKQTSNEEISDFSSSFYEGMSKEDYLNLYNSMQMSYQTSSILNTPFYYIFTDGNIEGGQAFNKMTNSFESLCKNPFCDHSACIFSWQDNQFTEEFIVHEDSIYILVSAIPNIDDSTHYYLYSTDLLLQNLTLVYEFPFTVENQYVDGESVFVRGIQNLCFYDNSVYCQDYYIDSDDMVSPTIYKLDLDTKEYGIYLEDTYLQHGSLKLDTHVLTWKNLDGESIYYDVNENTYVTDVLEKLPLPKDYSVNGQIMGKTFGYVTVDHTTEQYISDPFYEYYKTDYSDFSIQFLGSRDVPLRRGGEIFRVEINEDDEVTMELCLKMQTDGIPDLIYSFCIDGKTALVKYETYRDFENLFNTDSEENSESDMTSGLPGFSTVTPYNYKYALIDLETGTIIRDIQPIVS